MKKNILKTFIIALGMVVLVACGSDKTPNKDKWETYKSSKSITIGFDNTFVPMGFVDEKGKTVGFDVELATAVFAQYDIKIKWQPIKWELKETELNNGNIDLIWNGYSVTEERSKKVLFSNTYMKSDEVLVVNKLSDINQVSDMKGKILAAQSGSSSYDTFLNNPKVLKDIVKDNDAIQYETFTQAFLDLETKRNDAILVDKIYANYYLSQKGKLNDYKMIPMGVKAGDDFAVGARLSDKTLVKQINLAFKKLYKEGKYQEISKKWFGQDTATEVIKN